LLSLSLAIAAWIFWSTAPFLISFDACSDFTSANNAGMVGVRIATRLTRIGVVVDVIPPLAIIIAMMIAATNVAIATTAPKVESLRSFTCWAA